MIILVSSIHLISFINYYNNLIVCCHYPDFQICWKKMQYQDTVVVIIHYIHSVVMRVDNDATRLAKFELSAAWVRFPQGMIDVINLPSEVIFLWIFWSTISFTMITFLSFSTETTANWSVSSWWSIVQPTGRCWQNLRRRSSKRREERQEETSLWVKLICTLFQLSCTMCTCVFSWWQTKLKDMASGIT